MPDSYGENFGLTDSESNTGNEGVCKHKSYVETRWVFFFVIPNNYNVQFMPYQDKGNSVQVSFNRLTPVLANYHSLSFCRFYKIYWLNTCI